MREGGTPPAHAARGGVGGALKATQSGVWGGAPATNDA